MEPLEPASAGEKVNRVWFTLQDGCFMKKLLLLLSLASLSFMASSFAGTAPPNVLVILADDLGYGDVSFNGTLSDYTTPNMDSIAQNGALCTDGYVMYPSCSPSRAALLTGRYEQRFGYEHGMLPEKGNPRLGLPNSESTLAELLKPAGYVCGAIGKWHLGSAPNLVPNSRGFDEFFGFMGASSNYYNASLYRNSTKVTETSYLTEAFTREGVDFINRHAAQPFFLYLAYNAVHAPYDQPPKTYLDRVANISDPQRRNYAAMVVALDDGIGQVLQALETKNLLNNTLIFFLSDNGAPRQTFTRNLPLRGYKTDTLEGGIRIPFAVQWSGHLTGGVVYRNPVASLDIVATAVAAAGISLPTNRAYDGLNILPFLTGNQTSSNRRLFWRDLGLGPDGPPGSKETIWAVRDGSLKLVTCKATVGRPPALYNLNNDIGETQDLSVSRPADVVSLKKLFATWETNLIAPLWQKDKDWALTPIVLAGDWNGFNKDDSNSPWKLTRMSAPAVDGTPDGYSWFTNTIHVASSGGDTTPGTHSFTIVGHNTYAMQWGGTNIAINGITTVPFFSGKSLGPSNSISFQDGFYYSFRLLDYAGQRTAPMKLAVMKTSGPPVIVKPAGQTPAQPTSADPVIVSITASQPKSPEERIFLRWSTDFFITSHMVRATGSGINYAATIPAQASGTAVQYSIVTSTLDLSSAVASGVIDESALAASLNSKYIVQ
jgi:arylsulfatase A-like enzyme